jgi:hypothetical protein
MPDLWVYDGEVMVILRQHFWSRFLDIKYMHGGRVETIALEQLHDHGELLMRGEEDGC